MIILLAISFVNFGSLVGFQTERKKTAQIAKTMRIQESDNTRRGMTCRLAACRSDGLLLQMLNRITTVQHFTRAIANLFVIEYFSIHCVLVL